MSKQRARWTEETGLARIQGWARRGMNPAGIAAQMGITERTLRAWMATSHALHAAVYSGSDACLDVEASLYRMALGFTREVRKHHREQIREYDPTTGKKVRETDRPVERTDEVYVPPSVTAAMHWLSRYTPEALKEEEAQAHLLRATDALLAAARDQNPEGFRSEEGQHPPEGGC